MNPRHSAHAFHVIGYSYGGHTALAAAVARLDIIAFSTLATEHTELCEGVVDCEAVTPYVNDLAEIAGLDAPPDGFFFCNEQVWDKDRTHDLANHFTAVFLLAELYGDADAHAALAPNAVQFLGVKFEAVGY